MGRLTVNDVLWRARKWATRESVGTTADITGGKPCRVFHFSISGISSAGEARLYNALTAAGDYSEIRTALNWSQDWKLPEAGMRFDTGLTLALLTGGVATVAYLIEE